jgi:glycerophosphoryl diester phosphodiesterase
VAQGADGVELDVGRCASGEGIVHHDLDTRRTAGSPHRVDRCSLRELRRLDVGAWKEERFRGERIPTLAEVLAALPDALVNVELKSSGLPDPGLPAAVARAVREAEAEGRCVISSFDLLLLGVLRAVAPRLPRALLLGDDRGWALRERLGCALLGPAALHPQASLVTLERARRWRSRGLPVRAWTVDDPGEMERLAGLEVAALITNRPALARSVLERRHQP